MSGRKNAAEQSTPDVHDCKLRVSSNNSSTTGDQIFLPITLTGRSVPVPKRAGRVPASTTTVPLTHGPTSPNATAARKAAAAAAGVKGSEDRDRAAAVGQPAAPFGRALRLGAVERRFGRGADGIVRSRRAHRLPAVAARTPHRVRTLLAPRAAGSCPTPEQPVTRTEPAGEGT